MSPDFILCLTPFNASISPCKGSEARISVFLLRT